MLWLHPADPPTDGEPVNPDEVWGNTFTHATTLTVTDPVEAITAIADAAVTALTQA
ncbi:hypothetical protein AB0K25_00815 [Micromonospora sp. NPDC049257]|uniref:hypothetical protein n=1 Tax=Micromonospora sp. NPDC049257 TaxID=3155771 RepID=UPI00341C3E20